VRHLTNGRNLEAFSTWINDSISHITDSALRTTLQNVWVALERKLATGQGSPGLAGILGIGRQIMFTLAWLVSGILLGMDAQRDSDIVACEVAQRWVLDGQGVPGEFAFPELLYQRSAAQPRVMSDQIRTNWDCRVVWGVDLPADSSTGYRAKI
jgi:hypothetical protein